MPPPHPPEFRRRAVELARERAKRIAQIGCHILSHAEDSTGMTGMVTALVVKG